MEQDRNIYCVRRGTQEARLAYLNRECENLMDSGAYVSPEGDLYYITWRTPPKEGLLPPDYVIVSRSHPQADIYARHSHYNPVEAIVHRVTKDGGSIEAAIRSIDHILEGERTRETSQANAIRDRSYELFTTFSHMTNDELQVAQEKTQQLLLEVGLHPDTVVDEEKQRMAQWLLKGSSGEDSLGRKNLLVTIGALSASYRRAIERKRGIGEITEKFLVMREALVFERELTRMKFRDVIDQLVSASMLSGDMLSPRRAIVLRKMMIVLQRELSIPRVKTYRTVALEARSRLAQGIELLDQGVYEEFDAQGIITDVQALLAEELVRREDIYPPR